MRGFGAEVADFRAAASVLAGYEAFSWSIFHWAGPKLYFIPNQAERPRWLTELVDDDEDEGTDANPRKEQDRAKSSDLTEQALRRIRHRTGAPRWTKKLTKLIERHLGFTGDIEPTDDIPEVITDLWEIILELDKAGKTDLKDRAKGDRRKARRKEKKAERKAKKDKKGKKKKRRESTSSSSLSSSGSSSSSSSSGSSSSSSSDGKKKKKGKGKDKGKGK